MTEIERRALLFHDKPSDYVQRALWLSGEEFTSRAGKEIWGLKCILPYLPAKRQLGNWIPQAGSPTYVVSRK